MVVWSRSGLSALSVISLLTTRGMSQSVSSPNLDLSSLGQITLGGNFDSISVYNSQGQQESLSNNGTQSVLSLLSSGQYGEVASTDASIDTMCSMKLRDGTNYGIILGGNFTSIAGQASRSVALFNDSTSQVVALPGIQGSVSALLCDNETNTVYVGGSFEAGNSSNAILWVAGTGWANLPFAGFDAPVTSIVKAPNGHIIFGGSFTGLGTSGNDSVVATDTSASQKQVVNLVAANITSVGNTSTEGYGNPENIVCPSNGTNGPESTWLLVDHTPGSWRATMQSGFIPTLLRLWNTNDGGRGIKTWRFTAYPIDGILNMSYVDPATGKTAYCDATCPLSQNTSYQEFTFVNPIGMDSFQIDISDWYGAGGGLNGVELFQDQIFVYAVEALDEPQCSASTTPSRVTTTGPWTELPSQSSVADYLSVVTGPDDINTTNIVFEPDLKQSGNYSILVYTPGCQQDSSCSSRGIVNVTGSLSSDGQQTFSTLIYQTNDNEKYDQVFQGKIDAASSSFRPSVTITPARPQDNQTVVASRIQFNIISSTFGLNGLFDYDPNELVNDNFSASAINTAGNMLHPNAQVNALWVNNQTLYSAGQFSDDTFDNIMAFSNNKANSLPDGGLNDAVASMYGLGDFLYVGGNFTNTSQHDTPGLSNVAAYQFSKNTWVALGSGLNGAVEYVVPTQLNISGTTSETVIAFSGQFTAIMGSPSTTVDGLAIWVPSQNGWYQNLNIARQALTGQLTAGAFTQNGTWLGAGSLASNGMDISGVVSMTSLSSGQVNLQQLPVKISSSSAQASLSKRALTAQQNVTGVSTGVYYNNGGRNVTVFGGHFTATANGSTIENLMFLNGSNNNAVTGPPQGLDNNSTFLALAVQGDLLFAGGSASGNIDNADINGLVVYDLLRAAYRSPQPASLAGANVVVNSIAVQPGTSSVYVAGSFDGTSQDLSCPSVCMYDTTTSQWNPVGSGLAGNVVALYWTSNTQLMAFGNLTVSNNSTSIATYNPKSQTWTTMQTSAIPGDVTAVAPASKDGSQVWVSGTAQNGSTFLIEIDGSTFRPVPNGLEPGTVIRSLEMLPLKQNHGTTPLMSNDECLMVAGQLKLTSFGNAAVALFNGTAFEPLILATLGDPTAGTVNSLFSSKVNPLGSTKHHHSEGITILVALCAALGTIFLIILLGMLLERIQRHRAGYTAMPMAHQDKNTNINRVPPEQLFGSIGQRHSAPTV